jgi:hypothetical protein
MTLEDNKKAVKKKVKEKKDAKREKVKAMEKK